MHMYSGMLQVNHKCQSLQNPLKYKRISDSLRFENGKNISLTDSDRKSYLSIYFIVCGGIEYQSPAIKCETFEKYDLCCIHWEFVLIYIYRIIN